VNGFNCSCAPGFNGTQCETGNQIARATIIVGIGNWSACLQVTLAIQCDRSDNFLPCPPKTDVDDSHSNLLFAHLQPLDYGYDVNLINTFLWFPISA